MFNTRRTRILSFLANLSLVIILLPVIASLVLGLGARYADPMGEIALIVSLPSGIYAFIRSLSYRKKIRRDINRTREAKKLLIIASIAATGTFLSLCSISLSLIPNVEYQSPRDHIINDLNSLGASAYLYRVRPLSKGGGDGTYLGYEIPRTIYVHGQGLWADTTGGFSYRVIYVYPDSIIFEGRPENTKTGAVRVTIDSKGRGMNWRYFGDMGY